VSRLRLVLGLAASTGLGAACSSGGHPTPAPDAGCPGPAFDGGPLDPAQVAKGSALVTQYDCQQCHGTTMSGNYDGVQIPFSTLTQYPPNLTSDPATGLGCWTDDQVENAILYSIDNQGDAICGPMPHFSALGLTQSDAAAITAYLRSLPVFENNPPSGPSCTCQTDADCPAGESCLDAGSCTCESLACAIPGSVDGGTAPADAGPDAGVEDGGRREDGGREPDAGADAGRLDGGFDGGGGDAGLDAGADAGADAGPADAGFDAGAGDAGPADGGLADAGPVDAGADGGSGD
jgi:hypothetical protein